MNMKWLKELWNTFCKSDAGTCFMCGEEAMNKDTIICLECAEWEAMQEDLE